MPEAWAAATGKPTRRENQDLVGTYSLSKEPKVYCIRPRRDVRRLIGELLSRMQAVLALEGASEVPEEIFAKKYFHMRLSNGQIAGTASTSEEVEDRRRDHLVRVRSHMQQAGR